jgi:hypothetical protein
MRFALGVLFLCGCVGDDVVRPEAPPAGVEQVHHDLATVLRRDTDGLTAVTARDGSLTMPTGGRFGSAVLVRKNADGTTTKTCVEELDEAIRFLGAPTASTIGSPALETR